jgi:glycosyltransferase involved in cell wall biosynthesis
VPCLRPDLPALAFPGVAKGAILAGQALRWTGSGPLADLALLPERAGEMAATLNRCSRVLPATRFLAETLVRHGVDADRIEVVPYGTEAGPAAARRLVPAAFTADDPLRLVFMGTLSHLKGPQVLLDALAVLDGEARARVHLHVYGRGGDDEGFEAGLRRRAEDARLPVTFHGTVPPDQVAAALADGHLAVVPSIWFESTPLVLLSALAVPVPALVADLGGMTEVVVPGVHGQWSKAGDPRDLARAIASILDDTPAFAALHAAMPRRDRTMAHYADDVEAVYRAVVGVAGTGG